MSTTVAPDYGITVIDLKIPQAFDEQSYGRIGNGLLVAMGRRKDVIINFSGVQKVGRGLLAQLVRLSAKVSLVGGKLFLSNISQQVRKSFEGQTFTIVKDENEAIKLLGG